MIILDQEKLYEIKNDILKRKKLTKDQVLKYCNQIIYSKKDIRVGTYGTDKCIIDDINHIQCIDKNYINLMKDFIINMESYLNGTYIFCPSCTLLRNVSIKSRNFKKGTQQSTCKVCKKTFTKNIIENTSDIKQIKNLNNAIFLEYTTHNTGDVSRQIIIDLNRKKIFTGNRCVDFESFIENALKTTGILFTSPILGIEELQDIIDNIKKHLHIPATEYTIGKKIYKISPAGLYFDSLKDNKYKYIYEIEDYKRRYIYENEMTEFIPIDNILSKYNINKKSFVKCLKELGLTARNKEGVYIYNFNGDQNYYI